MPKISVVIPMYNVDKYVEKAIDSVIMQSFRDFECICVDDGSTDDTKNLVCALDDSRIKYLYQTNQGVSAARNAGIANADCEWMSFLDADDWWYEQKLEKQLEVAQKCENVSMTGCRMVRIVGDRSWIEPQINPIPATQGFGKIEDFFYVYRRYMTVHPSNVMIKREVFDHIGAFDVSLEYGEDVEMFCRIAGTHDVGFSNYVGTAYRVVPTSKTQRKLQDRDIARDKGLDRPGWADLFVRSDRRKSFDSMYKYQLLWQTRGLIGAGEWRKALFLLRKVGWSKLELPDLLTLGIPDRMRRSLHIGGQSG